MKRPLALITGASSGIGYELARVFAENGHDLVVTARREDRLAALADTLAPLGKVRVIPMDLSRGKGAARLLAELDAAGIEPDVLVNSAGIAAVTAFQDQPEDEVRRMVRLNIQALAELTHAVVAGMVRRGHGRILNVASVAGFQPVPGMSLYAASKAFVLSFSEGLSEDLRGSGVTVTALCPGLTRTEMLEDMKGLELAEPLVTDARTVALEGYRACMAGEAVRVPGIMNQALVGWAKHQPRWLVRALSGIASRTALSRR